MIKIRKCKYFSTLDINSAFSAIPLKTENRQKQDSLFEKDTLSELIYRFVSKLSPQLSKEYLVAS